MTKRLEQKQIERLVFHDKSIDEKKVNIHAFFSYPKLYVVAG